MDGIFKMLSTKILSQMHGLQEKSLNTLKKMGDTFSSMMSEEIHQSEATKEGKMFDIILIALCGGFFGILLLLLIYNCGRK